MKVNAEDKVPKLTGRAERAHSEKGTHVTFFPPLL